SLEAYETIMGGHPESVVTKTGRAEVLKALNRLPESLEAYETIMEGHPGDVVAKTGRAEVLKALNRLPESLEAYETIMEEHPEDVFAKNGCSVVLVFMGDYQSALSYLSDVKPVTDQDWVGYHIKGMIHLNLGNLELAESIFQEGIRDNPNPRGKEFFHNALALVRIKQKEYENAAQLLERVSSPDLQTTSNILRVYAFGALGNRERARQAFMEITQQPSGVCLEFKEELRRRYLDEEEPVYDEEWLNESAMSCYLRMAA
ncbi:MAG: tetratricopeptide repeat protein, partial [Deltaproteobacteria bacterium]|nr:tetratricopeptide repeat protein [Deltaproteobacteria bacterium]